MSVLLAKAKQLEEYIRNMKLDSRVNFFDSEEAYKRAVKDGEVRHNDINFINDITE